MRARFALVDFLESVALNQESGIKIGESLELIRRTTSDPLIEDAITRVRERIIAHGRSLSQAMEPETVFPGLVRQMVTAAEAGGHLAEMLRPIAEYYGLQARASLKRMIDFMTPGMIILLGVAIGPVISGVYTTLWMIPKLMGNM
jgi:type II secretory pathway component PulF